MKILYITDQVYLHGGAEKILIQKLNYWVQWYGYDVLLITTQQNAKPPFFELDHRVKHIDLDIGTNDASYFSASNIGNLPKDAAKLKQKIDDFNPDAIFLITLGFVRYALPFIAGKYKIYNEYHTSYYGFYLGYQKLSPLRKLKKKISYRIIKSVEALYTNIVFLNQAEFDHYKRGNAIIIPNFYDETEERVTLPKQKQVITLGRLSYQKGYDLLIDAWEKMHAAAPGWTLEIYGNGENRDALQQQIASKNLGHTIHLNEATNHVNQKLAAAAFYVMSSRFETFPMVLLEAMSNQLPVVSFDCPSGPGSMLTNGEDSFLVARNDVGALADKMLELISNEPLREHMGAKALENVQRFSPKIIMEKWNTLIKSNLGK